MGKPCHDVTSERKRCVNENRPVMILEFLVSAMVFEYAVSVGLMLAEVLDQYLGDASARSVHQMLPGFASVAGVAAGFARGSDRNLQAMKSPDHLRAFHSFYIADIPNLESDTELDGDIRSLRTVL